MRNRLIIFLLLASISFDSFGQDTTWRVVRVDEYLTLSMPGNPDRRDSTVMIDGKPVATKRVTLGTPSITLDATMRPNETEMKADDPQSLEFALTANARKMESAFTDSGFDVQVSDTTMMGFLSKRLVVSAKDDKITRIKINIFLINDRVYTLTGHASQGSDPQHLWSLYDAFLQSATFVTPIKEEARFENKEVERSYKWAYIAGGIGFVVLVALVAMRFRKKN